MSDVHQAIVEATIVPEPGALQINFRTLRPAKPIFTVWRRDLIPASQIAVVGETMTAITTHSQRILGLPQGVPLWLRIDAWAEDVPVDDPRASASLVCQTGTLFRTCWVSIFSLELLNSGDPDGGASMAFGFQVRPPNASMAGPRCATSSELRFGSSR